MTEERAPFLSLVGRSSEADMDLQAGSLGLSTSEVVQRYLKTPGHLLAILRFFGNKDPETVGQATGIRPDLLRAYEKGEQAPSLQHLAALAKHYGADLRLLLQLFGHVADDAGEGSMGIAAKFDGELTPAEKVDLKALIESFTNKQS